MLAHNNIISINPEIDIAACRDLFGSNQRIQIPLFLTAHSSNLLRTDLQDATYWTHVISGNDKVFEIPCDQFDALDASIRTRIDDALYEQAASGFQFRFDNCRLTDTDIWKGIGENALHRFGQFMNHPRTIILFRQLTGSLDISFADVQATRYRPGDFLTGHDDIVPGKDRLFAYVLNLTAGWCPEWGGLLLFHDTDNRVVETFVPTFNSLSLFRVGQVHSVSYVTPFARYNRLSITGWLRTATPI